MEIISNAHACTREWTHEKSWHRENLAPSWNHPVSSISLSDPSQKKKKREMSYSWTSSCHPRQPRKWRGIEWEEVGPWNWKSDWRFFFFSFFRPLFTTRSLYIVVLPSIHIIETKFCTQTKRVIRNLYMSQTYVSKNLRKILGYLSKPFVCQMVESFFWIFRNEIFGEEMTEKGESMKKVGRKSICVFWYIINDIVTTCRLNHNNNKENRYPKERKKEKEERKEISKSCCG